MDVTWRSGTVQRLVVVARPGDDLRDLVVVVVDAFNAAARMSLGTYADPEALFSEADVNLKVAGDYAIPATWVAPDDSPDEARELYLYLNAGASSSGIVRVYFTLGDA